MKLFVQFAVLAALAGSPTLALADNHGHDRAEEMMAEDDGMSQTHAEDMDEAEAAAQAPAKKKVAAKTDKKSKDKKSKKTGAKKGSEG